MKTMKQEVKDAALQTLIAISVFSICLLIASTIFN